jgi:hypothetical protein
MQFFDAKVRICFSWVLATNVCWLMFVLQDTFAAIGNLKGSILSQMITNN